MDKQLTESDAPNVPPNTVSHLSHEQQIAAEALGCGSTVAEAAKLAGVSRSTLYRWQRLQPFAATVDDAHRAEAGDLDRRFQRLATRAVDALEAALSRSGTVASVTAARMILDRAKPAATITDDIRFEIIKADDSGNIVDAGPAPDLPEEVLPLSPPPLPAAPVPMPQPERGTVIRQTYIRGPNNPYPDPFNADGSPKTHEQVAAEYAASQRPKTPTIERQ